MIFILVGILIGGSALVFDVFSPKARKSHYFWLLILVLTCISAFRYKVGIDSIRYEESYVLLPSLTDIYHNGLSMLFQYEFEPLWMVLCGLLKLLSKDFLLCQIVQASLLNILIARFIYKNTSTPFILLFFYYIAQYFLLNYETLREATAIALFLNFYHLYPKNKLKYFIYSLLCILFHYGAVILFVVPFFNLRLTSSNLVKIFLCTIMISTAIILWKDDLTQISFFGDSVEYRLRTYLNRTWVISKYSLFTNYLFPVFVLLLAIHLRIKCENEKYILLYFMLLTFALPFSIFIRFSNYFLPFYLVLIVKVINVLIDRHTHNYGKIVWYFILILMFSIPFSAWFIYRIPGTPYRNYDKYLPYNCILNPVHQESREIIKVIEFSGK